MTIQYSTFWSDIYYESIVEHDHRLRSICTLTPWINFDEIVNVDRMASRNDDRIASHPNAIYLNKLSPESRKFERMNKDVINKRHKPLHVPFDTDTETFNWDFNIRTNDIKGLNACSFITINPRNRWIKLYDRNPLFTSTISALSTQLHRAIQAQSRFIEDKIDEIILRSIVIPMDKYQKCYKVRIYHRQAWNEMKEEASFPSIWKEPDPSASVDDVSGAALRHITLLCRDVICECNKCTTRCPAGKSCDSCILEYTNFLMNLEITSGSCGSFAEGCMLPIFFVWNESNKALSKSSDIDIMAGSEGSVGFNAEIETNIFATIETKNCKPGYLKLRAVGNRKLLRFSENTELFGNVHLQNRMGYADQILCKKSFNRGPARTSIGPFGVPNWDVVPYYSCSSWPPIALEWINRERRSKWPTKEIIREIVLKGCRIVHKSHPSSRDPEAEFRFLIFTGGTYLI